MKLSQKSAGLARVLGSAIRTSAKGYVRIVRGGSEGAGLATLKTLTAGGPLFWLALAVLVASLAATAYLALQGSALPTVRAELWPGEAVDVATAALLGSLCVMAFGWSYLLSGAARHGLGAYVVAAAYVGYFGLIPGAMRAGDAWFPVLPIWLLVQAAWVGSHSSSRWRYPLLLALSLTTGILTHKGTGFYRILPGRWGPTVLGLSYFFALANPWVLHPRRMRHGLMFRLDLSLFLGFYALAIHGSASEELADLTFVGLHHLLGLLGYFWYWMGLDLIGSAGDIAEWVTATARDVLPLRAVRGVILAVWALALLVAYGIAIPLPVRVLNALSTGPLGRVVLASYAAWQPSFTLGQTSEYALYITGATLATSIVLLALQRLSHPRLMRLFYLWLLALLVTASGLALFTSFVMEPEDQGPSLWALALYLGGMFWEILKNSDDLVGESTSRLSLFSGFLLCLAGVSLFELSAGYGYFQKTLTISAFSGAIFLGIPYLVYTYLYTQGHYTPVPHARLLLLFGLGMGSALVAHVTGRLLIAPFLWLTSILAFAWRQGRWDDPLDGPVYGLALALGFVVYYTRPELIPIPAHTRFAQRFAELLGGIVDRVVWPWQLQWWGILASTSVSACVLGLLCGRAHERMGRRRHALLVLGMLLSTGILAVARGVF